MARSLPNWHSILFIPAHIEKYVKTAHARGADAIQLDLEDSVPFDEKETARKALPSAVSTLKANNQDIIVRVNSDLKNCIADLSAAAIEGVSAITISKVKGPDHLQLIDEHLTLLEIERGLPLGHIGLIALVETVRAISNIEALASANPRLIALALGTEDFCADCGINPTFDNLLGPSQKLVFAARLAGIKAFGLPGSIAEIKDMDAFQATIENGKNLGFDGAFSIHPNQVEVINQEFTATATELEQARHLISEYEKAISKKCGALVVDGKMVDLPIIVRAHALLAS